MSGDEKRAFDVDRYATALRLAAAVHAGQKVPGTDLPYLVHVVRVAAEVLAATEGSDSEPRDLAVACALLHDSVEDAAPAARSAVRDGIRADLGPEVLDGVEALTKNEDLPKRERMRDSIARIRAQARPVWIVKLCDRLVNLDPPPRAWSAEKVRGYAEEAREILAALGNADAALARRFKDKLRRYEERLESESPSLSTDHAPDRNEALQARFDWAVDEIRSAYAQLGHRLGWRFLLSPRRTFKPRPRIALMSCNPGGSEEPSDQPHESCEAGSAYLTESWHGAPPGDSPLQGQIRSLFALLQTSPDETLSAYFVPFRAPIWQEMQAPADTLAFARELWRILLAELEPEVLVVNGADAFDQLATVLPRPAHVFERPAGWGNQRVAFAECGGTLAIRIPTLSRFKLFSRAEGRVAMEDVARRVDLFRRRSDEWRRP